MMAPEVTTALGRIRGRRTPDGIDVFKGIRYAEAPSGDYRWQPPRPVQPWSGVVDADNFGPGCPQHGLGRRHPTAMMDEDCLRLNVWRSSRATQDSARPVMVWIHGGGFVSGSSSPARYDGSAFAQSGVILVSIDYRVGRLGFFAHPALADEPLRGNYGLMDQLEALRWVGRHIENFGGDPHNITLFGESAGAMSIVALLTSRIAKGLFHKAIIQSGGGRHNLVPGNDWGAAVARTEAFARQLQIPAGGSPQASLNALREVPVEHIVDGLHMGNWHERPGYCAPMIDGVLIEDEPQTLLRRGAFHPIPLIIGTTDADLGFPPRVRTLDEALSIFQQDSALFERAKRIFAHLPPMRVAQLLASDSLMVEPARFVAQTANEHGIPAWLYRFSYVPRSLSDGLSGAPHGGEIECVFNTLYTLKATTDAHDQRIATAVHRYWVAFAQHGRPEHESLSLWNPFKSNENNILIIDGKGEGIAEMKSPDPWQERLDLVAELANTF